jgi:hypothetical protein
MFPQADIFTHVYNNNAISPLINSKRVITSSISRLPFAKKLYQLYMPLMPESKRLPYLLLPQPDALPLGYVSRLF